MNEALLKGELGPLDGREQVAKLVETMEYFPSFFNS